MLHFMFLGSQQHLKAVFGSAAGLPHRLRQESLWKLLHPLRPALAFRAQQLDDFGLRARTLFFELPLLEERSKVEAVERRQMLLLMNETIVLRQRCYVDERFRYRAALRSGTIAVVLLRNVFGNENCVLAHRAQAVCELFGPVKTHASSY